MCVARTGLLRLGPPVTIGGLFLVKRDQMIWMNFTVEAHRMVEEKRLAVVRAYLACTEAILNGQGASAPRVYFDVYRRAVESNRKRLSNRRWRWPR